MQIINQTKATIIAQRAEKADTFIARARGLLHKTGLADGEALIITRCQQIHMFFMRFAIDVLFVGKTNRVIALIENIKPFQISPIFFHSYYVVELPVGTIQQAQTEINDAIVLVA